MKGLLLKDWYMMKKYCRAYLLIAVVFMAVSFAGEENLFFVFYPCLLCGMIPVNLLGYDERSHWVQYSAALPYTRAQIVTSKYLIGLFSQIAVLLATAIVQGLRMGINSSFHWHDFTVLMLTTLIIATFSSSICLPFVFKLGVEKGRIAYYVMIGFVCAGSVLASSLFKGDLGVEMQPNALLWVLSGVAVAIYGLSWYLAIVFYKKREL